MKRSGRSRSGSDSANQSLPEIYLTLNSGIGHRRELCLMVNAFSHERAKITISVNWLE